MPRAVPPLRRKRLNDDTNDAVVRQAFLHFLSHRSVAIVTTTGRDDRPSAIVAPYSVDENLVMSFLTDEATQQHANLSQQQPVILTIFDTKKQTTLQIIGTVTEVTDNFEVNQAADNIFHDSLSYHQFRNPPFLALGGDSYVAFHITPERLHMSCYGTKRNYSTFLALPQTNSEEQPP